MKLTKIQLEKIKLATAKDIALDLFEGSGGRKITLDTPDGYHFVVSARRGQEKKTISRKQAPRTFESISFVEAHQYLDNARARFETQTPEGYSDCKANCRCALISALKQLTGLENIKDAVKELGKRGVLGGREEEFITSYGDFLAKLHNLASKKGSHPPMTTEPEDAQLVLGVTTEILQYLTRQTI